MLILKERMRFRNEKEMEDFFLFVKKSREEKEFAKCKVCSVSCPRKKQYGRGCYSICGRNSKFCLYEGLDF